MKRKSLSIALFFFGLHYAITPVSISSFTFVIMQLVWFGIGIIIYVNICLKPIKIRQAVMQNIFMIVCFCSFLQIACIPDFFDFYLKYFYLKEVYVKENGTLYDNYKTEYPSRLPLLYDSRYYYRCDTKADADTLIGKYPSTFYTRVGLHWFIVYEENVYNPDFAIKVKGNAGDKGNASKMLVSSEGITK